jgi:hypothetical protein
MIWPGASSLRRFAADNSQYYSDCEEHRLTGRCSQRLIRRRCFDVQLEYCACQSCHLRSPAPWLSLRSLGLPMRRSVAPLHYLPFVVIALVLASCSRQQFDPTTEAEKLLRRDAEWCDLAAAGKDIEKFVSYWSNDAVLIFPGRPVLEGKAAIRAYVIASFNTPDF